jgi:hypothetical protein
MPTINLSSCSGGIVVRKATYVVTAQEALSCMLDTTRNADQGVAIDLSSLTNEEFMDNVSVYRNGRLLFCDLEPTEDISELQHDVSRASFDLTTLMFFGNLREGTVILVIAEEVAQGESSLSHNHVDEDISSQVDGISMEFTTSQEYISGSLMAIYNGVTYFRGNDFVEISPTEFAFLSGDTFPPIVGSSLTVTYRRRSVQQHLHVEEDISSQIDGVKLAFTTGQTYLPNSLTVIYNGVTYFRGNDFEETSTSSFSFFNGDAFPPEIGGSLVAVYRRALTG